MLTANVRLEGFDTQDWLSLWAILGPSQRAASTSQQGGGVVAIHQGRELRKLLHTRRGAMDRSGHPWPMSAEVLAAKHDARWGLVLEHGALDAIMELSAAPMRPDDDLLDQVLTTWRVVRSLARQGRLDLWPGSLRTVPVPAKELILGAMNLFVPDGQSIVIAAWAGSRLHTSLALHRAGAGFDVVLGPDELRGELGAVHGNRRSAHRKLCGLVERRMGRVAMGMSADTAVWATMVGDSEPGRWARMVGAGDVVIEPMPAGVAIPIAIDAGRVAFVTLRAVARRMGVGPRDEGAIEKVPDFDLWTMLRAWAGLGAALRGRSGGAGGQ